MDVKAGQTKGVVDGGSVGLETAKTKVGTEAGPCWMTTKMTRATVEADSLWYEERRRKSITVTFGLLGVAVFAAFQFVEGFLVALEGGLADEGSVLGVVDFYAETGFIQER